MYLKLGLITLSSLLLFNGCSTKEVDKKEDILFKIQTTNKNLKPINYELNISNIGYGECMDFNKMDSGLLRKKEGLVIDTTSNKKDIQDTFREIKHGHVLKLKVCNTNNQLYKITINQEITKPIIEGKTLEFNGHSYKELNDLKINNEANIEVGEKINYMDLFDMSIEKR